MTKLLVQHKESLGDTEAAANLLLELQVMLKRVLVPLEPCLDVGGDVRKHGAEGESRVSARANAPHNHSTRLRAHVDNRQEDLDTIL